MKGFAKIIELEKHDVVVVRLSTDEDGEHFTMTATFEGMSVSAKHGYKDDEEKCIKGYDMVNEKTCQDFVDSIYGMMKD